MGGTVKEVAVSSIMYAPTSHSGMIIAERRGARDIDMKMPRFTVATATYVARINTQNDKSFFIA